MTSPFTAFPIPTGLFDAAGFVLPGATTSRSLDDRFADVVSVKDYGAHGDGIGDNSAAFIAAAASLNLNKGGTIFVPPGVYNFTAPFDIPQFAEGSGFTPVVDFYMSGAVFQSPNAISYFRRLPTDQSNASNLIGAIMRFHGGYFSGSNIAGSKGLDIGAIYCGLVDGCVFANLDVGLEAAFCLALRVVGCRSVGCLTYDFNIRAGDGKWSGATTSNSQSNHTTLEGCRVFGDSGATANYRIAASSGVSIRNCIGEGANPTNCILFDAQGSTVVKSFTVDNFHCENIPSNALIKMTGTGGGVYRFQQVHSTIAHKFLDASGLSNGTYVIRDTPYTASYFFNGPAFTKDTGGAASKWHIENWGGGDGNPSDTVWWDGGVVPGNMLYFGAEPNGNGMLVESGFLDIRFGPNLPGNFANDAAAATGGVPIGGAYRNGSVLQVRVT